MPWKRRGERTYYYQPVRDGRRVRTQYLGAGDLAHLAAEIDALARAQRRAERQQQRDEVQRLADEDRVAARRFEQFEQLVAAALRAAGYHRPKRGPWRKRRTVSTTPATTTGPQPATPAPGPPEGFVSILKRGCHGDLAALAVGVLISKEAAGDPAVADKLARQITRVRAELEGPRPTAIERLLAERAALCWADAYVVDLAYFGRLKAGGFKTTAMAEAHDRRRDRAHRRLLQALKALAAVRKLDLTAIQVNIAAPFEGP